MPTLWLKFFNCAGFVFGELKDYVALRDLTDNQVQFYL